MWVREAITLLYSCLLSHSAGLVGARPYRLRPAALYFLTVIPRDRCAVCGGRRAACCDPRGRGTTQGISARVRAADARRFEDCASCAQAVDAALADCPRDAVLGQQCGWRATSCWRVYSSLVVGAGFGGSHRAHSCSSFGSYSRAQRITQIVETLFCQLRMAS